MFGGAVIETLLKLLAMGGIMYLLLLGILYFRQEAILFYPQRVDAGAVQRFVAAEREFEYDGVRLRGWFVEAGSPHADTIVYYGGNGEELSRSLDDLTSIGDFNLLAVNYRGYGESEGAPSERALKRDAVLILDSMIEQGSIVPARTHVVGRSLGTGVAVHVAANYDIASLTLISPFDSIESIASSLFPIFPVSLLIRHPFRSVEYVDRIKESTLIMKAEQDNIIPHQHTNRLIEAWQSPLRVITLDGTSHNYIYTREFYREIGEFLSARAKR